MNNLHPQYGSCDGFGPLWTCSQCTGVIACKDGTFSDAWEARDLSADDAAARIGDFLLNRAEMVATAAWGCSDSPAQMADFVRRSLWFDMPGNPWRNEQYAKNILAQGMSAGTAETAQQAQGEARQPGPAKQDAPTPSPNNPKGPGAA
jgi:hypothetical protein